VNGFEQSDQEDVLFCCDFDQSDSTMLPLNGFEQSDQEDVLFCDFELSDHCISVNGFEQSDQEDVLFGCDFERSDSTVLPLNDFE
jgi:hypothetical protein